MLTSEVMEQAQLLKRPPFNPPVRGDMVGPYRVVAPLGVGGNGYVYKVERAGGLFALKVLGMRTLDARGQREIDILRHVKHPHVVRFLGCDRWPLPVHGYLYIVMELVEGRTLGQWVLEENPCAREVVRVFLILLRTLTAIHAQGVLHRDLKGDNILIRDADGQPVLVDFGTGWLEGEPPLTRAGPSPFTPEYRSPESLRFERAHAGEEAHYSPDVGDELWAAGVVFYWLLTDRLPFGTRYEAVLQERILHETPKLPREVNPHVPPALSALCMRMLEKRRAARFATCAGVAEALEAALAGADASWGVPLVDPLAPDLTTTQEEPGRVPRDAAEREAHQWNVSRPRRGQKAARKPMPVREEKGAPEVGPPAPARAADAPPREAGASPEQAPRLPVGAPARTADGRPAPGRRDGWTPRAAALGAVMLGALVLAGVGAWHVLPRTAPAPPPAVTQTPPPGRWPAKLPTLQASGVREVAGPGTPAEAGAGAAASLAPTPALEPATMPRKEDSRSTAEETPVSQRKGLSASLVRKCVGAACCAVLGACSGAPQVRPAAAPLPKPEACPSTALASMKELGIDIGDEFDGTFDESGAKPVTVTEFSPFYLGDELGKLGVPVLYGHLYFGQDRVYGRFTQAQVRGQTYPVCLELQYRGGRGTKIKQYGGPNSAVVFSVAEVKAVKRFE